MAARRKASAALTLLLAIALLLLFQTTKHDPALSRLSPFVEDPYDAVGSFGVQLALFAALLTALRALRPYPSLESAERSWLRVLTGEVVAVTAIATTLVADLIAMLRYPTAWLGAPSSLPLIGLVAGLALVTFLAGGLLFAATRQEATRQETRLPPLAARTEAVVGIACLGLLALYPDVLRRSTGGAILTAAFGMAILFAVTWGVTRAICPRPREDSEDVIDDAASIRGWLGDRSSSPICRGTDRIIENPVIRAAGKLLNPRVYPWRGVVLIGVVLGLGLVLIEAVGEGAPAPLSRLSLVLSVFVGLEGSGVVLGYALLGRTMSLFRLESPPARRSQHA